MAEQKEGAWDSTDLVGLLYHFRFSCFLTSKRKTEESKMSLYSDVFISSCYYLQLYINCD